RGASLRVLPAARTARPAARLPGPRGRQPPLRGAARRRRPARGEREARAVVGRDGVERTARRRLRRGGAVTMSVVFEPATDAHDAGLRRLIAANAMDGEV